MDINALLSTVPTVGSYLEATAVAEAYRSKLTIPGVIVAKMSETIFLQGEDGLWAIPLSGVSNAIQENGEETAADRTRKVSLSVREGTRIVLMKEYEVGVTIASSTPAVTASDAVDQTTDCGCKGSQAKPRMQAGACPPRCWRCPNGACCCPPMNDCLRVGCAVR